MGERRAAAGSGRRALHCRACVRRAQEGGGFRLQGPDGTATCCLACAVRHPPLLRRSTGVALIVGSALIAINHGDTLAGGTWPPALLWKLPLTYAVPFVVATWGALANSRMPRRRDTEGRP